MTIFLQLAKKIISLLILVQSASVTIFGQSEMMDAIEKQFDNYRTQAIQEKIFVHTDKSFYLTGETIWFKLYVVDGCFNKPLDLSKISYVEIFSRDQKPILQAKIALSGGKGNGSFVIPSSVNSGNYVLRAYTNWMKNFPSDFYFEKRITLINPQKKPNWQAAGNSETYDIQFFPEGGNLVNGIKSKIAFRAVNKQGKGIGCKGVLVNDRKDTVAWFQSLKFGLGQFLFTPVHGQSYTARLQLENDSIIQPPLPPIYDHGCVMGLTEPDKDHILVSVSSNVSSSNQFVYLFVHTRNMIQVAQTKSLTNGRAEFLIAKDGLGEGVSHLTVFNGDRQPVCERLYFRRPAKKMSLEIKPGRSVYSRREKVSVDLLASDPSGKALAADLSVSVFMTDSLQPGSPDDILTYLWLGSDLKGVVESPEFYVTNSGAEADEAIDNLLLTQGWRRFRWEDLLQNSKPAFEFIPEYDGHIITGKIIDKRSGMPAENIPTYLSVPGQRFKLNISTSNQKGQIHFDVKNFHGGSEMIIQTNTKTDSIFRIDISNPFDEKLAAHPFPAFELSEKWAGLLNFRSMHVQVQNNFTRPLPMVSPETGDSTAFYGNPDKKYFLDDYTRFVTMEEVMREYVAEVRVSKRREKFHYEVMNLPYHLFLGNDPLVLMDGVPVFDINRIIDFDPLKIKKLEIVARKYFLDSVMNDGIVSYTTYQGNLGGFQLDPNALILEYPGTQLQPEYYSPVYETSSQSASRLPDFRNLLYWSPDITTDDQGKKLFSFYTSDLPGKYAIVVQGITANGYAGSSTLTFLVNR